MVARGFLLALVAACACAPQKPSRFRMVYLYGPPEVPGAAYEHYIRGRHASIEGRHEEAIVEFRRAAALAPDHVEPRVAIVEELLAAGRPTAARAAADSLVQDWPKEPTVWLVNGRILSYAGRHRKAARAYERAIALDPGDDRPYLMAAGAYQRMGNHRAAEDLYRRLLKRRPQSVEARYRLGRSLYLRKALKGAERHLWRAVSLDADHIDARVLLADIYRHTGRAEEASQMLRDAFDRSGEDIRVGRRLVFVLLEVGDRAGARDLLDLLDGDWRSSRTRLDIGYLYLSIRMLPEALAVAEALLSDDPGYHDATLLKARVLTTSHRDADALALALSVPEDAAVYAEARALAVDLLGRIGDVARGLELAESALAQFPRHAELLIGRARLLERQGDVAAARSALDTALEAQPYSEDLVYARAVFEERTGDPDRAVTILSRLLHRDPDNVTALNFIGYSYANRGIRLDEAEQMLRRAADLAPDDGYVLDSLGWVLFRKGHIEEAAQILEHADRLAPEEPEILLHLGEVTLQRGDRAAAQDLFRRALSHRPEGRIKKTLEDHLRTLKAAAAPDGHGGRKK